MIFRFLLFSAVYLSFTISLRAEQKQVTTVSTPFYIAVDQNVPGKKSVAWARCFGNFQTNDKRIHLAAVKPLGYRRCPEPGSIKFDIDPSKGYITIIADGGETITETGQGSREGMHTRAEYKDKTWKFVSVPNRVIIKAPSEKPGEPLVEVDSFYLAALEAVGTNERILIACEECKSVRAALESQLEALSAWDQKFELKEKALVTNTSNAIKDQSPLPKDQSSRSADAQVVEKSAANFISNIKSRRFQDALSLVKAPWLDAVDDRIVTDNEELKLLLKQRFGELNPDRIGSDVVEIAPYLNVRARLMNLERFNVDQQDSYKTFVERLDHLMGETGWVAQLESKTKGSRRVVLLRQRDGTIEICGGPFGYAYLNSENGISSEIRKTLISAERFELFSLDPLNKEKQSTDSFHGYRVLGTTINQRLDSRRKLLIALQQGIDENGGEVAGCFNPRHGIRAIVNGQTIDLVICFECYSTEVYAGNEQIRGFIHTESPQSVFDDILRTAGIAIAKKPKK